MVSDFAVNNRNRMATYGHHEESKRRTFETVAECTLGVFHKSETLTCIMIILLKYLGPGACKFFVGT